MTEQEQRVINVMTTLVPKMNSKELMDLFKLANEVYERIERDKLNKIDNKISRKSGF